MRFFADVLTGVALFGVLLAGAILWPGSPTSAAILEPTSTWNLDLRCVDWVGPCCIEHTVECQNFQDCPTVPSGSCTCRYSDTFLACRCEF
jgi:hypothetical protein